MTKVIGFDLDDTLVPEVLFILSGIHFIAHFIHERLPSIPEQRIISCMEAAVMTRNNHYSALEKLISDYDLSHDVDMNEIVTAFRNHKPDPTIYHSSPSLLVLLRKLKENRDIRMVLITDGRSLTQRNKIKAAGLDTIFENADIYISEETRRDKTYPDTFLRVMEKHAGAKEFHYIGDNPAKDFLHPSRLGWHVHKVHGFPLMVHQGMPR